MKRDCMTDESIRILVHAFYEKVRGDPELAPVFMAAMSALPAALDKYTLEDLGEPGKSLTRLLALDLPPPTAKPSPLGLS